MADERWTYKLLILELPDPNRDLYYQVLGVAAKSFQRFPKLPAELRLRIWRYCLPGPCNVFLERLMPQEDLRDLGPTRYGMRPITLSINHESRHETLKHYYIMTPFFKKLKKRKGHIVCLDPTIDTIHVNAMDLAKMDVYKWFKRLSPQIPEFFKAIKTLEVSSIFALEMLFQAHKSIVERDGIVFPLRALKFFTGLEQIGISEGKSRFSPVLAFYSGLNTWDELVAKVLRKVTAYVQRKGELYGRAIPRVVLRPA